MTTHLYVSSATGDDTTGTGAYLTPWATIGKAAQNVVPDCVVHVWPGTYSITSAITTTISGTASGRIAFQSEVLGGARIRSTGIATAWTNSGSYTDIVGFDISEVGVLTAPLALLVGINNTGSNCSVKFCSVHDIATAGTCNTIIGIYHSNIAASNNSTIGNRVNNIGPAGCTSAMGIRHSCTTGTIQNNIVSNCARNGIYLWDAASGVTVSNNTVFVCANGIIVGNNGGGTDDNTTVANNIVYSNSLFGIRENGTTGTHNTYHNNCGFLNTSGNFSLQNGNTSSGTVNADPKFVNYLASGTGDYHLQATSPCIGAGTSTGAPTSDYEQRIRPIGTSYDIGAYEYYSPPTITGLKPDGPYGTTIGVATNQNTTAWQFPAALYADVLDLGIAWIRAQCPWDQIETTQTNPQTFGATPVYDDFVKQCNANGIRAMITVKIPPSWWAIQGNGGLMDPMATANYALYLLNRYNGSTINSSTGLPYGKVQCIELGNEDFDLTYTQDHYASQLSNVLSTVVPILKAAYPDVAIGNAALLEGRKSKKHVQKWMQTLFTNTPASVITQLAYLNFHAYFGRTADGTFCNDPWTEIPVGADTNLNWPDYFGTINTVQKSYGYNLEIWCTETGWFTDLNFNHDSTLLVDENTRWTYYQYELDQARNSGQVCTHWFLYKIDEGTPNHTSSSDGYSPVQVERTPKKTYTYTQLKSYIAQYPSWLFSTATPALFPTTYRRDGTFPTVKRRDGTLPQTKRRG